MYGLIFIKRNNFLLIDFYGQFVFPISKFFFKTKIENKICNLFGIYKNGKLIVKRICVGNFYEEIMFVAEIIEMRRQCEYD